MNTVFESNPIGTMPFENPGWVKEKVLRALRQSEWVSAGELYPATSRRVKRDLLHSVLKSMLLDKEIGYPE